MSEQKFKIGDQVVLKSGGPKMTVNSVNGARDSFQVSCSWFDGAKPYNQIFFQDALEIFKPYDPNAGIYVG